MTKQEFLYALEAALSEELNSIQVNEQINYYRQYIEEQAASGRSESEVLDELGDARIIAHNIIDGIEEEPNYHRTTVTYTTGDEGEEGELSWKTKVKTYGTIAIIIAVVVLVLALVTRLIIWMLPSIIVIAVVLLIFYKRRDGR